MKIINSNSLYTMESENSSENLKRNISNCCTLITVKSFLKTLPNKLFFGK